MAEDALNTTAPPKNIHFGGQRKIILILLCSQLANLFLASILFYIVIYPREPDYFTTLTHGQSTKIFALNHPNQSDSSVIRWASIAATAVYTYDFGHYRTQLPAASVFFTEEGWAKFLMALKQSNSIDTVVAKKLIVSAVTTSPAVILKKGMLNGVYAWRIQMRILVTYQSASEFTQKTNIVTLLVVRVPTISSPSGIGISDFIVTPASGVIGQ